MNLGQYFRQEKNKVRPVSQRKKISREKQEINKERLYIKRKK